MSVGDLLSRALDPASADQGAVHDAAADRVLDAALRQFELFGLRRSTMDEVARRAGLSRVTVYRRFPGKQRLVEAVVLRELQRFLGQLDLIVTPLASPHHRITEGFIFTVMSIRSHPLLSRLLESEPESLLPYLTVDGAPFIAIARAYLADRLRAEAADLGPDPDLVITAEVVVRLILSFVLTPESLVKFDDPAVARQFALRYVAPLIVHGA